MDEIYLTVDGVECPCPSECTISLSDVSAADSGRTQDYSMQKNRVAQKWHIALKWINKTPDVVSQILTMFNPEYINVKFHNPMTNAYETREFYVGDRAIPVHMWTVGRKIFKEVSFTIIER